MASDTPTLDLVSSPADMKDMDIASLRSLADELRKETIDAVSTTGGHLGAGLGVVELTVALHYIYETPRDRFDYKMRSIGSGGETLGAELLEWGRETFGLTINEFYGQTECNLVVGNCGACMPVRPGYMGRAVPGHDVGIVDDNGNPLPMGEVGNIAVRSPDPVMFLRYWDNPKATAEKFAGDWLLTGDTGSLDEQGYFRYVGRNDDVITTSGYRVGPGEIEDCLMRHPAVALAAAVGIPDPLRTEVVKAFIVLRSGYAQSDALVEEIQAFVKTRLAAHEYPRHVAFVDSLPMTTTGKIMRRELRQQAGQ